MFCASSQKNGAVVVTAAETMVIQHSLPGSVVCPEAGNEVTMDNQLVRLRYSRQVRCREAAVDELRRKQFRMELEPQICFWGSFDGQSQDEYIAWHENSTHEPSINDDKQKDLKSISDTPSSSAPSQGVNLKSKTPESVSSKELPRPALSIPHQNEPQNATSKDALKKFRALLPRPIPNIAPRPKTWPKQVRGHWRPQNLGGLSIRCLICGQHFRDRRTLNAHLTRSHTPTRNLLGNTTNGPQCGTLTIGGKSDNIRTDENYPVGNWVLQCSLCQMTFFQARDLHQHSITMHGAARIVIKMPWQEERTKEEEKNSGSSQRQAMTPEAKVTQVSSVDSTSPSESTTEKKVIRDVDTAGRNSAAANYGLSDSLSTSSASRTVVVATEALPSQPSNSSDAQKKLASRISCSISRTPEKIPHGVTSVTTTGSISTTCRQDDNGRLDRTSMSNLVADGRGGGSDDTLCSQNPILAYVCRSEVPTIHIASESTSSGTCSQRETSVCTVAPTAKESTSPIVSTHHFPSSLSSPILPSGLAYVGRNGNEEKSATAPECAQPSAHVSPSSRPNLKRPQSDLLTDCLHCSARAGGDICPQKCMRQTPRTPISLPVAICMAESHESSPSLATLVSSTPVTTVTPSSNQRHCDVCMNLRRCKGECQVEMTAKMLLGKTHEFLAEINRRPLEVVKPLVHALQRLLFTMEANVFVAYMNDLLPEASRNAVENPYLKRILSQPTFPNEKPQDVARTTIDQPSNVSYAGFQEATGFGKRGGCFQCQCSSSRFKGTISGQQVYGPSDSCSSLIPLGSQLATSSSRIMASATSLHSGLQISSKPAARSRHSSGALAQKRGL
ncbi:hypothetical protein SprV_0100257200 [Sparganum proliferum]